MVGLFRVVFEVPRGLEFDEMLFSWPRKAYKLDGALVGSLYGHFLATDMVG